MRVLQITSAPVLLCAVLCGSVAPMAAAQTRILPLGDSITHGGQSHASYRYALWFDLVQRAYPIDFVGREQEIFGGDPPDLGSYPNYLTSFDRDHEGHWGFRTDEIAVLIDAAAAAALPDVVLIHLGTNDIGQSGASGVTNADTNLRFIIGRLRVQNPAVAIVLARILPIGCCTSYTANAGRVTPLNAVIDQIALDLDTASTPVRVVDLNTGFDLGTMMQADGLHPNLIGEAWMAHRWRLGLEPLLTASLIVPAPGLPGAAALVLALCVLAAAGWKSGAWER